MAEELAWAGEIRPPKKLTEEQRIHRLERIVDGVKDEGIAGMRTRLENVETVIKEYKDLKLMLRGALVLMGLLTATNAISLYALAQKLGVVP